jgi:hypothetical protein
VPPIHPDQRVITAGRLALRSRAKEFGENLKSLSTESESNTGRIYYEKTIPYIIFASRRMRSIKHSIG